MGRPQVDSEELRSRVERKVLDGLDAYVAAEAQVGTRAQAVRIILADWLGGHGFLKHREGQEGMH